jgi:hypothetical protein
MSRQSLPQGAGPLTADVFGRCIILQSGRKNEMEQSPINTLPNIFSQNDPDRQKHASYAFPTKRKFLSSRLPYKINHLSLEKP